MALITLATDPLSDGELVRGAQSGDHASLGLLLDRHHAAMHAVALSVLGHCPDAEDAVQDAMLAAMSKIGELRDPAAAGSWLRAIVRNCCLMRMRTRREVPFPGGLPIVSEAVTPEEAVDRHALRDWIWHAIEELSAPLRLVVMLRYFSEMSSYEQIAVACDIPVGTVRSRLSQARVKLTASLAAIASQAHPDIAGLTSERRLEGIELLEAAERGEFARALSDRWMADVEFISGQGERGDRDRIIAAMDGDLTDNVHQQMASTIASHDLTIWDMTIINPPEDPLHCPPAVTWLLTLSGGRVNRMRLFHPERQQLP
ncbi:MAG: RNA polymerase sigma factor [Trebonia sp.]